MTTSPSTSHLVQRLRIVRWLALLDGVLLIMLVASSLTGQRAFVSVLGPLHGINFLLLVVVVAVAALDGLWGWWYPLVIVLTAGPIGAFVGERIILRRMGTQAVETHPNHPHHDERR